MTETNLGTRAEDELAAVQMHSSLAAHHSAKAHEAMERYLRLLGPGDKSKLSRKTGPKCLAVWTEWLERHGPAYRQDVQDGTGGVKFTERATPYTVEWEDEMAGYDDGHFPVDTICRIRGLKQHDRGAPPTVYFLWSQRFNVYGEFGVGPVGRPTVTVTDTLAPLLGVIMPPEPSNLGQGYLNRVTQPMVLTDEDEAMVSELMDDGPDPESVRYATLEEWHARWDGVFDRLAPTEGKPTEDEMAEMLATMPEDLGGDNPKAILAVSYSDARRRSRDSS